MITARICPIWTTRTIKCLYSKFVMSYGVPIAWTTTDIAGIWPGASWSGGSAVGTRRLWQSSWRRAHSVWWFYLLLSNCNDVSIERRVDYRHKFASEVVQSMKLSNFDYDLPESFIAQTPAEPRDSSRLMVLSREGDAIQHKTFRDIIEYISPRDVLVMNNTRVIPARIYAHREDTGGKLEILLLRRLSPARWQVIIGGKRADAGMEIAFPGHELKAVVVEVLEGSQRVIEFSDPIEKHLETVGETPLPPYISSSLHDSERYQTVYSRHNGSAAAPTAGLHFTSDLLIDLRQRGVQFAYCTLHIGLDTFQPVRVEKVEDHKIHSEWAELTAENARIINEAKLAGGRIIAVGTTSARTLETAGILSAGGDPAEPSASENMCPWRPVIAFQQDTNLFIYPGYKWRVLDGIITNFHLPKSTLLMMLSAFIGREPLLDAYETAKAEGYRFYSFGDAMFIS